LACVSDESIQIDVNRVTTSLAPTRHVSNPNDDLTDSHCWSNTWPLGGLIDMLLAAASFLKVMARTGRDQKEMHISAGFLFAGRSLQPDEMRDIGLVSKSETSHKQNCQSQVLVGSGSAACGVFR